MTKTPSFPDTNPNRLAALKALSAKCLVKDMETRLQIVGWTDFTLDSAHDPMTHLRSRLERKNSGSLDSSAAVLASKLHFDRSTFERAFIERVRFELIATCGNKLPVTLYRADTESPLTFEFSYSPQIKFKGIVRIDWLEELYSRMADIFLGEKKISTVTIAEAEDQAVYALAAELADLVDECLDLVEGGGFAADEAPYFVESSRGQIEVK